MTSSGILRKVSPTGASIAVSPGSSISSHSRTLFRRYEEGAEGASPIRPFLDIARRQDRAPAADRRHPSHRTSSGKMTGAPRMERVQLNGADTEYHVRGSGAPVVFIHGAILSDGFVPVIELTGIVENFQIVHYRRRGYAGSSRALADMTMQGWAGDCIALLNHLGIASAQVAGHSLGACIELQMAIEAPGRVRKLSLLEPPLFSLVPSGEQFTEWVASVREIYDSGDKTAATDTVLAGAYGQDYRRFTDGALPAGAFDRAVSDIDTFFQVELGAMQRWNITTEGLKDIRHPVLSMRGRRIGSLKHFWRRPAGPARPRPPPHAPPPAPLHPGRWRAAPRTAPNAPARRGWKQQARAAPAW